MNVLIIPEDFRKDQYILKPMVEKMMASLGYRKSRVVVCKDPHLGGVARATKWEELESIIDRYKGMTDVFLLIVDRDGKENRQDVLSNLEVQAKEFLGASERCFVAANAWQEVEVWALAGMRDLPKQWNWQDVRAHRDPKEIYYDVYAKQRGVLTDVYEGRDVLGREAAANYTRVRQLCDEVQDLETRVQAAIQNTGVGK